jgi:uncharacterized Zn finger protein
MIQKDIEPVIVCPDCGGTLIILEEWVNIHDKEVLWHCWDCDAIYQAFYKLVKIVKLIPEQVDINSFLKKVEENEQ